MRIKMLDCRQNGPPRLGLKAGSPAADEDCNSNTSLAGSEGSQHSALPDLHYDNSDYLWFLDFNPVLKDSGCHHQSVLSSLSASYKGVGELTSRLAFTSRYDALARDLDANLAEADMESFRTRDIHALLMNASLPCDDDGQNKFGCGDALLTLSSDSILAKLNLDYSFESDDLLKGDGDESVGSLNTMSICKSELLFSPVKEPAPAHYSVDSLDCDLPPERELILTCQANKDNYTIAFEGSVTAYSQHSECVEPPHAHRNDKEEKCQRNEERMRRNLEMLEHGQKKSASMARSDLATTTWSKLRVQGSQSQLKRHPSGNNNEDSNEADTDDMTGSVIKSQSLPNLVRSRLTCSLHSNALSNSTVDSFTAHQRMSGTGTCMKLYDVQHNCLSRSNGSQHSEPMSTSSTDNHSSSDKSQNKQFSLVKLFMKQKSLSNEGVGIDQLDRSDCWPSSGESDNSFDRKKQAMHTSEDCITEEDRDIERVYPNTIYDVVEEEIVDDRITDSDCENLYATVNKPLRRNINLNNSPLRLRNAKKSCSSSGTSVSISSCSESEGTQITRMHKILHKESDIKATSTQVQVDTSDKSMQTSLSMFQRPERELYRVVENSFLEKLKEGDYEKPVYVLYPNYALPDISFLNSRPNIHLNPQKVSLVDNKKRQDLKGKRPFSCNDIEILRKRGLSHIRDWDSLNFLLPVECKQLLSEVPEIMNQIKESPKPKDKHTPSSKVKTRPMSCDCNNLGQTTVSSSSSTATQPSSGYRGSSTMLTDSAQNSPAPTANFNPLFVYRYDSATSSEASYVIEGKHGRSNGKLSGKAEAIPPRPPLPKSILRKPSDKTKKSKRYSMFEVDDYQETAIEPKITKRRSLQEPYYLQKDSRKNNDLAAKRLSQQFLDAADKDADYHEYYHDEGVGTESSLESGKSNEVKYRPQTPPLPKPRTKNPEYVDFPPPGALISSAELQQLEEFLKQSGVSCQNMEDWDQNQMQKVRNQVTKFLNMKRSQEENQKSSDESSGSSSRKSVSFKRDECKTVEELKVDSVNAPPNSPNISAIAAKRPYQVKNLAEMPICEEAEVSPDEFASPVRERRKNDFIDVAQKRALVSSVTDAVETLIQHFAAAADRQQLALLGDSARAPACAKLALNALCPALYAVLRDGLRDTIDTSFGAVANSAWQTVEATARQGPITQSLNELVLRINSEDAITEGLLKFNAFVLGLLNAQSVDAWVSYLRTQETIIRRHYRPDSLLCAALAGDASCRLLLDSLVAGLEPLRLLPFSLDLMFELRELHRSFRRLERPNAAPANLTLAQRNILKLVRSLHSSGQSSDECRDSQTSVIMRRKDKECKEPSTPDLLNASANARTVLESRVRPRSCVNPSAHDACPHNSHVDVETNRRWSGVQLGSKLMQAFDRLVLDDSDEYTDSLERTRRGSKHLESSGDESANSSIGGKFRRLQLKWEMLSNAESQTPSTPPSENTGGSGGGNTPRGSRIPRPVTSPVRPTTAPQLTSPTKNAPRGIPVAVRKATSPVASKPAASSTPRTTQPAKMAAKVPSPAPRISRVDAAAAGAAAPAPVAAQRPSSLPYSRPSCKMAPRRRAASASVTRHATPSQHATATTADAKNKPVWVRTLWHRLPSDSGHLAFNEGEALRLVTEVDGGWLLCCRAGRKGLVPRDAVMPHPQPHPHPR